MILNPFNTKEMTIISQTNKISLLKVFEKVNEEKVNNTTNITNKILNWILSPTKANITEDTHPIIL